MKASILFATGLILAAGTVVGSINVAHAGEGGSAGSISAQFSAGNKLTATAGAVAVGKSIAITSGSTGLINAEGVSAVAIGSAGAISTVNFNTADVDYTGSPDSLPGEEQKNDFTGTKKSSVNLVPSSVGVSLN
jgi:hypothetical protein